MNEELINHMSHSMAAMPKKTKDKIARALVLGVADIGDLLTIVPEAYKYLKGKKDYNFSRYADEAENAMRTSDFGGEPESAVEAAALSVPRYAVSGAVGAPLKAVKGLAGLGNFLMPTKTGAIGTAAGTYLLEKDPENVSGALAASLAPSLVSPLKNSVKGGYDYARKVAIQKGDRRQGAIKKELSKRAGAEDIKKAEHDVGGELGREAVVKAKSKIDKQFEKDFKIRDFIIEQSAPNLKVDVKPAYSYLVDTYKSLDSDALKEQFLKSPSGKSLQTLLDVNPSKSLKVREDLLEKYGKKTAKRSAIFQMDEAIDNLHNTRKGNISVPYNDAKEVLHHLYDKIGNASEIGTREQGRLKHIAGKINKNLDKAIKKKTHAEDYSFIKDVNNRYKEYSLNQKIDFNTVLDVNPNDMEAVYEAVKKTKPHLKKSSFYAENMSDKKRDKFAKTYLRDLGTTEGDLDITKLSKNLSSMQSKEKKNILDLLKPENRKELESSLSSLKSLEKIKEEGTLIGDLPVMGKGYGKLADSWMHIGNKDKIISRDIKTLERLLKPKASLMPKPDLKAAMAMRHKTSAESMPSGLTPEEEAELAWLESQEMEEGQSMGGTESQAAPGLTPEEEAELAYLESQG